MPVAEQSEELKLIELLESCIDNPYRFVMTMYDWGHGELVGETGPDEWQTKILTYIGANILTLQQALQIAMRSGTETGKTALIAWLIQWYISTRKDPRIVVTANTGSQLSTKTWAELAKWHKLSLVRHLFTWTATKYYQVNHPETWFAVAMPWSLENAQAFAGTHAKYVLMIFDEASEIPDPIWEVAEGAATKPGHLWIVFGNPSQNTGRFAECFKKYRHRWHCIEIDARQAKKSDKGKIQQWIEDYGEDSDFVRVRVKGMEPRASSHQMFSYELVEKALGRQIHISQYQHAPIALGCDIARSPAGDQTVFTVRQGLAVTYMKAYRGINTMQSANYIAELIESYKVDACFIDEGSMGAGVIDRLRQLGYEPIAVNFGSKDVDRKKYFNKGAEMWNNMLKWMESGGCIPNDPELRDDLTAREYGYANDFTCLQLQSKEDMAVSPDKPDSLALTFAMPVSKRNYNRDRGRMQHAGVSSAGESEHNPFDYI